MSAVRRASKPEGATEAMVFSILRRSETAKRAFVTATMSKTDTSLKGRRSGPQSTRKRRGSLRALSASLPGVTKRAFARRGLTGAELAHQWPAIVGAALAQQCRPRKLRFPRPGEAVDGNLTLRVAPAWALEIQHLETVLLERINGFFGYRAVSRLTLQQGPLANQTGSHSTEGMGPQALAAPAAETPLDGERAAKLAAVEDPALRGALERLGRSLQQKRAKKAERA